MMRSRIIYLALIISLSLCWACEKVILLSIQGDIEGWIIDNNGQAVVGATVTASFEAPSESGFAEPRNTSTTTDADGYYRLTNLWDEVSLKAERMGLESVSTRQKLKISRSMLQADFSMNGSPTIRHVVLDKTKLLIDPNTPDSIFFQVEIEDVYNSQSGTYESHLLLEDSIGNTRQIITAEESGQSADRFLMSGLVKPDDLPGGTYDIVAEVIDPDGNIHRLSANESILLE